MSTWSPLPEVEAKQAARFTPGQTVYWCDHNGIQRSGTCVARVDAYGWLIEPNKPVNGQRLISARFLTAAASVMP